MRTMEALIVMQWCRSRPVTQGHVTGTASLHSGRNSLLALHLVARELTKGSGMWPYQLVEKEHVLENLPLQDMKKTNVTHTNAMEMKFVWPSRT